uniref:Protein NLRC5 n=1 Tax=Oryctolagus cuniculus TaxID=9986 RepID=A0A5F9DKF4_RABIT
MDIAGIQMGSGNTWDWLVQLLSKNPEWLSTKVKFFLPNTDLGSSSESPDPAQGVTLQLKLLCGRGLATWRSFIYCVCMELEVPLELEVLLLSTWGHEEGEGAGTPSLTLPGLKRPHHSPGPSPQWKHCRRQRRELAQRYLELLRTSVQEHYGSGPPSSGQHLASLQAYIPPILQWSRATTPLDPQKGANSGDPKTEDGTDVSIQDLFSSRSHKGPRVTVLLGKAGMGKTTLAHRLCQKWAEGQLHRFQALFLFEFRKLNLITRLLTLPQLLFDLSLNPEAEPEAVFQYLQENASRVLLIFDGLDEALYPCSGRETVDPHSPRPALALFSDLCRGTLLPGCWVMATSRPGKLPTCLPTEAAMVHMWGFDGPRVEEYVSHFFGEQTSREAALAELRANRQLQNMCAVPALCLAVCLCLYHLLPGSAPDQCAALLPTVTQLYMRMVLARSPRRPLPAATLLGLGEVALRGLEARKTIFYVGDIAPPLLAFGAAHHLLTSFRIRMGPGHWDTGYAFTHLSLQEFFAALYLMASPKVDEDTLARHITLNSRWVLRTKASLGLSDHLPTFLAGLASHACRPFLSHVAQNDEARVGAKQTAVVQVLRKMAAHRFTGPKVVELCHCVAETQVPELAQLTAQRLPYQLPFHNFPLTYTDLAALASVLEHRAGPIHLDFEGCPLEPHCPEALAGCGQIENLSFKSRKCGDAFAEALSRSLPTLGNLQKLGLTGSKITARGISHLVQALSFCPQLEEISLHDNQLKDQEVLGLVEGLLCLALLRKLDLSRNSISVSTLLCLVKAALTCPTVRTLQVREADLIFLLSPSVETATELQSPSVPHPYPRLQKCQLKVHHAEMLIALLQEGPPLEELDLSGNQLEDEGCRLLAEAAPQLHIARKLDLSDNQLSVAGVSHVLHALSTCSTLAELHIRWEPPVAHCHLPLPSLELWLPCAHVHTHAQAHTRTQLLTLSPCSLSGNALGDEGAALLAQLLPGLGPLQSLEGRSLWPTWEKETAGSGRSPGPSLIPVLPLRSLSECQLEPPSITCLIAALQECPGPLEVHCRPSQVPCPLILLGSAPVLLRLSETGLTPRSPFLLAEVFIKCPQVQKVELRWASFAGCGLTQEHVEPLCSVLGKREDLCQLDLSANLLGDDGLRRLLECLPRMPISGSLDLSHNSISQESVLSLLEMLPSCPRVREASVSLGSEQSFWIHFSKQEEAGKMLRLSECSLLPEQLPRLASGLSQVLQLVELTLSRCCLGLEQLSVVLHLLRHPAGVLSLRVEEPWLGRAGVLALLEVCAQASGNVTAVSISGTQQQLCVQSRHSPSASRLAPCDLGTHHSLLVQQLTETCARLQRLSLSQVNLSDDDDGDASSLLLRDLLPALSELKSFRLTSSCVSTKGLSHLTSGLGHCHHLEELDLSNNQFSEIETGTLALLAALEGKRRLQRLSTILAKALKLLTEASGPVPPFCRLSWNHIDDVGCCHISEALRAATRLEELILDHNQIGDTGAWHLAAILPGLPELRKIDLSANGIGPAGGVQLAASLALCRHLEELMLGSNALGDPTALQLARGLPPHLRVLHLRSSRLGPEGVLSLVRALDGCPHVEEISLAENSLAQGLPRLCTGLPQLRQMDLVSCEIDNQAAKHLAASFLLCPALEEILLSWNLLGDEAAAELAQVLPQMRQLKRVDLEKNRITARGARLLAEGLAQGSGIQVIRLWNNPIPADAAQHLQSQEPRLDFAFFGS